MNHTALTLIAAACLGCGASSQAQSSKPAGVEPERFVSSTLKFAMAELGRSSPGARLSLSQPVPASASVRRQPHGSPHGLRPMSLAMSVTLPGTSVRDAQAAPLHVVQVASASQLPSQRPVLLAGWRLASNP